MICADLEKMKLLFAQQGESMINALQRAFEQDPDMFARLCSSLRLSDEYIFTPDAQLTDFDPHDIAQVDADIRATVESTPQAFLSMAHKLELSFAFLPQLCADALQLLRQSAIGSKEMLHASRCLLLVNPDSHSMWAARKKALLAGSLSFNEERKLLDLVLRKHPKSGEMWSHRRWLMHHNAVQRDDSLLAHELAACSVAASVYAKNYMAWTHRYVACANRAHCKAK